jgi:ATP-dependent helicase/nuclease subunit A
MSTTSPANTPEQTVADLFQLSGSQRAAALQLDADSVVTAGAGSGKTRTLVAHYLVALASGRSPAEIAAVTFTEKAAREMRSRARAGLGQIAAHETDPTRQQHWRDLEAQVESARIGTIHSLCAEILRRHPAEASLDPQFQVADEGTAAVLKQQVVADTLTELVDDPDAPVLFEHFSTGGLERLLKKALDKRLEVQELSGSPTALTAVLQPLLAAFFDDDEVRGVITELTGMSAQELEVEAGEKLAAQVMGLCRAWSKAEQAFRDGNPLAAIVETSGLSAWLGGRAGKKDSRTRAAVSALKGRYEQQIAWLLKKPVDLKMEAHYEGLSAAVYRLLQKAIERYLQALRSDQMLDFDDLESGALALLSRSEVAALWQQQIAVVLVDEFQDTNQRQRKILEALGGGRPGSLFIVGDARQSIYRFRGADVTVFNQVREAIQNRQGFTCDLDLTYRTHPALLSGINELLRGVMGEDTPAAPYRVNFSALNSGRSAAPETAREPYIEWVIGQGEDAQSGRRAAALALGLRLLELKRSGELARWNDAALLFRASSNFSVYEDAFEDLGIPFVTISGRGFFNRPEVRDLLNLLRALANPFDDLSVAGMLRSPAVGMSDEGLFRLRWCNGAAHPAPLRQALSAAASAGLSADDQAAAERAARLFEDLSPLVDRLPVAELLERLVHATDYRAILAAENARLGRNLDKLVSDAYASNQVRVAGFFEYLQALQSAGAREGEAPSEAEGAVQIMTIHKAKGLEFKLTILAEAGAQRPNRSEILHAFKTSGVSFLPDRWENPPLHYRIAQNEDKDQSDAEDRRLLYVALTRACDKLILCGHQGKSFGDTWLKTLLAAAGFSDTSSEDSVEKDAEPGSLPLQKRNLLCGQPCGFYQVSEEQAELLASACARPELERQPTQGFLCNHQAPLFAAASAEIEYTPRDLLEEYRPAIGMAIGKMVHRSLQAWCFPNDPQFSAHLQAAALEAGLVGEQETHRAVERASLLLSRFTAHPLWGEIDRALERHHEVPYYAPLPDGQFEMRVVDLLYRTPSGWHLIDFKTDLARTPARLEELAETYRPQIHAYAQMTAEILAQPVSACLCFLDGPGGITMME